VGGDAGDVHDDDHQDHGDNDGRKQLRPKGRAAGQAWVRACARVIAGVGIRRMVSHVRPVLGGRCPGAVIASGWPIEAADAVRSLVPPAPQTAEEARMLTVF
jgi:hypothetical protein